MRVWFAVHPKVLLAAVALSGVAVVCGTTSAVFAAVNVYQWLRGRRFERHTADALEVCEAAAGGPDDGEGISLGGHWTPDDEREARAEHRAYLGLDPEGKPW